MKTMSALALIGVVIVIAAGVPAGETPASSGELTQALERLADRAELQEAVLYRIQCLEQIIRMVHRRRESSSPEPVGRPHP